MNSQIKENKPVKVGQGLSVRFILNQLFGSTMQQPNMWISSDDSLFGNGIKISMWNGIAW